MREARLITVCKRERPKPLSYGRCEMKCGIFGHRAIVDQARRASGTRE